MFISKNDLIIEETQNGLRPDEIQSKYGFSLGSIYYHLSKSGLEYKRGKREETKLKYSNRMKNRHASGETSGENHWSHGKMKIRGEFVYEFELIDELSYYLDQDLTLAQMAELMQIDRKSITNRLRKFGLQKGMRSGERHPDWKGGHSKYRGEDWYSQRQKALIRDNYTCQDCNVHRDKLDSPRHMHVHHISPYQISNDNSLENLITLCVSCHNKREHVDGIHSMNISHHLLNSS